MHHLMLTYVSSNAKLLTV